MIEYINGIDQTILFFIQETFHFPVLDKIMIGASYFGSRGLVWIVIALLLTANRKTRFVGLVTLMALLLSTVMGEGVLKHLIQRPRPYADFPFVQLLIDKSTQYSFPSGHTTSSFAAAYVLSRYVKKNAWIFWTIAGLIAFSRVYLFMHYPTDIIGGILLGLACGEACVYVYERKFKKRMDVTIND